MSEQSAETGTSLSGALSSPNAVVGPGIEALRANDEPYESHGIETLYGLVTPAVRRAIGLLPRFAGIVRRGYAPLLAIDRVGTTPVETVGDHATQEVTVVTADGEETVYESSPTRQSAGAHDGRWLVDGIPRIA